MSKKNLNKVDESFCAICDKPIERAFVNSHDDCFRKTMEALREAGIQIKLEGVEVEFEDEREANN